MSKDATETIELSRGTWTKLVGFAAVQLIAIVGVMWKFTVTNEARMSVLETNQQMILRILERHEEALDKRGR